METCSSAEDVTVKTRKPYTITKQRERWTEDEHGRFLEALKLHGRAWQRIEEHIGTKTAVQIRSHAQKFFTKLEKEAQKKGVPFGDVHHIDIPPPRPKRKPSNPYPRKTYGSSISSLGEAKDETSLRSASSLCLNQQVLVLEKDAPFEKHTGTETSQRTEGASEDGNRLEILNLFQDNPCTSRSSENKRSANSHITGEFIPLVGEIKKSTTHESSSTVKVTETTKGNWDDHTDLDNGILKVLDINSKLMREENEVGSGQTQEPVLLLKTKPQSGQSCPKHVPMHFIDGNKDKCDKSMYSESSDQPISSSLDHQVGSNSNPNPFTNPFINSSSSMPSIHQDSPTFSPFVQFNNNQDSYRFFLNFSSTFSSLIISSLLQNPAAHAAANLAASFFPSPDLETSIGSTSDAFVGTIPQVNPSSSMAAIASATVAAASAWWATHGLFPLSHPPLPTGIAFMATQANSVPIPTTETPQATGDEKERKGDCTQEGEQLLDPQSSMPPGTQCVTARSFLISSSGSDEGGGERSHCTVLKSPLEYPPNSTLNGGLRKSDEARSKTNIYRSSCGSNTTSSSELETDIVLEQVEECKEADKEANCGETNNRRFKSIGSVNESWKEVSEEGRIAFQALFSREVLPQSFSRTNTAGDGIMRPCREKEAIILGADHSIVECGATLNDIQCTNKDDSSLRSNENLDELFLIGQGKLKTRRTGFKPYKRCSVDAKESRGAPVSEEKGIKRIRLQE